MIALRWCCERGLVQRRHHVQHVETILTRHRFDGAIVARGAELQLLEYRDGRRMTLFHVPDDRVAADQLIESKHKWHLGIGLRCTLPAKELSFVFSGVAVGDYGRWVISPSHGGGDHLPDIAVDPVIVGELRFGILILPKGKKRTALERWFDAGVGRLHCLAWDADTGLKWAELLARLRTTGRAMPIKDSLIAATAIVHGLAVVTRNRADFAKADVRIVDPFVD